MNGSCRKYAWTKSIRQRMSMQSFATHGPKSPNWAGYAMKEVATILRIICVNLRIYVWVSGIANAIADRVSYKCKMHISSRRITACDLSFYTGSAKKKIKTLKNNYKHVEVIHEDQRHERLSLQLEHQQASLLQTAIGWLPCTCTCTMHYTGNHKPSS
jgi:hypothetical protein